MGKGTDSTQALPLIKKNSIKFVPAINRSTSSLCIHFCPIIQQSLTFHSSKFRPRAGMNILVTAVNIFEETIYKGIRVYA